MKAESNKDVKRWLQKHAEIFLAEIGIKKGRTVLDFGCNEGNYTIPAARIVGEKGKVYAIDKEGKSLIKTMKKVKSEALKNVVGMISSNELEIPLAKNSVDIVLLYDTLHRGYFPKKESRKKLLNNIHKILRENGFVSIYLTHLRQFSMTFKKALAEIENAGFVYDGETHKKLVHDNNLVRG
jgi:ubiquinone/menaquinone biosynthesis C-methylase UbiE